MQCILKLLALSCKNRDATKATKKHALVLSLNIKIKTNVIACEFNNLESRTYLTEEESVPFDCNCVCVSFICEQLLLALLAAGGL